MNDMTALLPHIKLRFNIEHPSFEECYAYGYECALAEVNESENPYRLNTKESDQWLEGWWAGFYGEEPLYNLAAEEVEVAPDQQHGFFGVDARKDTRQPERSENSPDMPNLQLREAANDHSFHHYIDNFLLKIVEVSGMLAVSAAVGYQVLDLVA